MAGPNVPEYAVRSLSNFLNYLDHAMTVLQVSIRSLTGAIEIPGFYEAILSPKNSEALKTSYETAKRDAAVARKEAEIGFPFLLEFNLVGLWGAIEASIEDLMVALLSNEPALLREEVFSKLRIPLAEYEALDKDERMRFLVSELRRSLHADQRQGVAAFESVLRSVGLSGSITDEISVGFWEMSNIRNVIVHRRSRADRKFVRACPNLGTVLGDRVVVTTGMLTRYSEALRAYANEILRRIDAHYAQPERCK